MEEYIEALQQEITTLREAVDAWKQEALQLQQRIQQLQPFETFVERTADGMTLCDTEGNWTYVNQAAAQLYGFDRAAEMIGRSCSETFLPEERERILHEIHPALQQYGRWSGRVWLRRTDGTKWLGLISTYVLCDEHGTPVRHASMVRDVTVEYKIEQRWQQVVSEMEQKASHLQTFHALAENAPDGIVVTTLDNIITYVNPQFCILTGYEGQEQELVGRHVYELYDEQEEDLLPISQQAREHGHWRGTLRYKRRGGGSFQGQLTLFAIREEKGRPVALGRIVRDITDQIHHHQEMLALKERIILAQRAAIEELSTPLIPLSEQVVVMPLVGSMDRRRAQQVIDTLLEGVSRRRATVAILDITGVRVVDSQVANTLIEAAQAVRLLGAQVVLTGVRPDVAQTLVHLGIDLSHIVTRRTLQEGIAFAMRGSS